MCPERDPRDASIFRHFYVAPQDLRPLSTFGGPKKGLRRHTAQGSEAKLCGGGGRALGRCRERWAGDSDERRALGPRNLTTNGRPVGPGSSRGLTRRRERGRGVQCRCRCSRPLRICPPSGGSSRTRTDHARILPRANSRYFVTTPCVFWPEWIRETFYLVAFRKIYDSGYEKRNEKKD